MFMTIRLHSQAGPGMISYDCCFMEQWYSKSFANFTNDLTTEVMFLNDDTVIQK